MSNWLVSIIIINVVIIAFVTFHTYKFTNRRLLTALEDVIVDCVVYLSTFTIKVSNIVWQGTFMQLIWGNRFRLTLSIHKQLVLGHTHNAERKQTRTTASIQWNDEKKYFLSRYWPFFFFLVNKAIFSKCSTSDESNVYRDR